MVIKEKKHVIPLSALQVALLRHAEKALENVVRRDLVAAVVDAAMARVDVDPVPLVQDLPSVRVAAGRDDIVVRKDDDVLVGDTARPEHLVHREDVGLVAVVLVRLRAGDEDGVRFRRRETRQEGEHSL